MAIIVFLIFVVFVIGLSLYLGSKAKTSSGYYAAGGQIHWGVNGIAFAGDYLSAASFLGICGMIATVGYDGLLSSIGYLAGWIVALCRTLVLQLLAGEIDNYRFLIDGICVQSGMRGQGLGQRLVEALCAEATARGYDYIRLDVIDTNWRARALYERLGFVAVRSEPIGWLRYVFGFSSSTTMVRTLG